MILTRRGLIGGLASLLAAPAIVRASSLMPVNSGKAFTGITWIDTVYDEPLAITRGINGLTPYYGRLLLSED